MIKIVKFLSKTFCKSKGFPYAGSQNGGQCFCGHKYGTFGTSANCTTNCGGNSAQKCGGPNTNSVFDSGLGAHYIGCFADWTTTRDFAVQAYPRKRRGVKAACTSHVSHIAVWRHVQVFASAAHRQARGSM